ncbi:MAG: hypothetical protein U9R44_02715 [Candidatus Omnitrophota bacterium]|nr:hypothetical protein [Candidatus Omnitrophota bacterium]
MSEKQGDFYLKEMKNLSRKSKKEINDLLKEYTKNLDKVDKAQDKLEPYYRWEIDGVVDDVIKNYVSAGKFKYFEACKFKAKALIFIKWKIEEWDKKYKRFVLLCIREKNFKYFEKTSAETPYSYYYFPFFEAMEFEHLLFQGKACLDSFSKAIGSFFEETPPNKLSELKKMLKTKVDQDPKAAAILDVIKSANRLNGIVLDPKKEKKKSIRDLISHRQKVDLKFAIFEDSNNKVTCSPGAQIGMRHPEIVHLYNYSAIHIASKIWFYITGMMKESFKILFPDEIKTTLERKTKELTSKKR